MDYSNRFGSQFPDAIIDVGTRKDIDNDSTELINQYYNYIENNNIEAATNLYNQNKDILEPYSINMAYCNRLEEEIYNTALLALKSTTTIVSQEEPVDQADDSYWLQEY